MLPERFLEIVNHINITWVYNDGIELYKANYRFIGDTNFTKYDFLEVEFQNFLKVFRHLLKLFWGNTYAL